jgi:hypothetical protein
MPRSNIDFEKNLTFYDKLFLFCITPSHEHVCNTLTSYVSAGQNVKLSPCHTRPHFHCVGTALFDFPGRREIAKKKSDFS